MASSPADRPASAPEDRREEKRFPVTGAPPLTATSGGAVYTCYLEEVSLSGVRVRFKGRMPQSNVIALEHPTAGTLVGRCVWRDESTMGVELQFPHGDLERVLRCLCLVL